MKLYFKCHRTPDGSLTDWYVIDSLPEVFPDGSTVSLYPHSLNRIYNMPGDSCRYFYMDDGALCLNCGAVIDKATALHAESLADREICLCKICWGRINHGDLKVPITEDKGPLYRLVNNGIKGY